YQFVACFWSPDYSRPGAATVRQAGVHNLYNVPLATDRTILGDRRYSDVSFPAMKVAMYDNHDRHPSTGKRKQLFHAHEEASQPLLFFDTSVRDVKTSRTNRGFDPGLPLAASPTIFRYEPTTSWEPPTKSGAFSDVNLIGHYRWTRAG